MEPELPEDLVFSEILSKLPAKSLMRFKSVSKTWSTRISTDSSLSAAFSDHQLTTTGTSSLILVDAAAAAGPPPPPRLSLLAGENSPAADVDMSYLVPASGKFSRFGLAGISNGLVCLRAEFKDGPLRVAVWNPSTREFRYLPETHGEFSAGTCLANVGFGFDRASKSLKAVKIIRSSVSDEESLWALVLSGRGAHWRRCNGSISGIEISGLETAVEAHGALHWLCLDQRRRTDFCILRFCLRDETLQVIRGPPVGSKSWHRLTKWKGSLAAITHEDGENSFWAVTGTTGGSDNSNSNYYRWAKVSQQALSVKGRSFRGVWRDQFVMASRDEKLFLQHPTKVDQVNVLQGAGPCAFYSYANDYVQSLLSVYF